MAKGKFEKAMSALANEAGPKDTDFSVLGDPLDNRSELQFAGEIRIASVRALQFYESLQLGRGQWKEQVVLDDQNKEIMFYVAPDKKPCQMRREFSSKHLKSILASKSIHKGDQECD